MNPWGNGHLIKHNFFHGLILNSDIPFPGGEMAHVDSIQMFTEGSYPFQKLTNTTIEENIFADSMQGIHISNNDRVPNAMDGLIIRNNVFWGQEFNFYGGTAWMAHGSLFLGEAPGLRIENNLYHMAWNNISLYTINSSLIAQGNIFVETGTAFSLQAGANPRIDRGTKGNILWHDDPTFRLSPLAPDVQFDPQIRNINAITGTEVAGPDGIPFTADDAWRPLNPAAATYGPQGI